MNLAFRSKLIVRFRQKKGTALKQTLLFMPTIFPSFMQQGQQFELWTVPRRSSPLAQQQSYHFSIHPAERGLPTSLGVKRKQLVIPVRTCAIQHQHECRNSEATLPCSQQKSISSSPTLRKQCLLRQQTATAGSKTTRRSSSYAGQGTIHRDFPDTISH